MKVPPNFSELTAIRNFIGVYGASVCVAIVATLAFELPIDAIYKSIRRSKNVPDTSKSD